MKTQKINVEDIVEKLFECFPNAKYIALNPGICNSNELHWLDQWYFVGYEYQPDYAVLDGWWSWVYDKTIKSIDEEEGLFFLHMRSGNLLYKGQPLQTSKFEFANVGELCWHIKEDGSLEHVIGHRTDENEIERNEKLIAKEIEIASSKTADDIFETIFKPQVERAKYIEIFNDIENKNK